MLSIPINRPAPILSVAFFGANPALAGKLFGDKYIHQSMADQGDCAVIKRMLYQVTCPLAGAVAEAYWNGIPDDLQTEVDDLLPSPMSRIIVSPGRPIAPA